jgi:lysine-specific permease
MSSESSAELEGGKYNGASEASTEPAGVTEASSEKVVETRGLKHSLKARHMSMISLGGAIGTGLFLTSGLTISDAGPGGAMLAYALIGAMVYFLMTSMGEMSTYMPLAGSFSTYAARFVEPSFGFAIGWNYWYNGVITLAFGIEAGSTVMRFWFPETPSWAFSALFLVILTAINFFSVRGYGEAEFWLAGIKVVTVIVFLIVGVLLIFGVLGSGDTVGFSNWTQGDAPFHGGFAGIMSVFIIAGFSFHGTEIVAVAAGESENPRRDVPKAIKQVFWRVLIFYILTMFVIGSLIPYNDPDLLLDDNISASPFTLVFAKIGIPFAAGLMNAVILTAVLSVGNGVTYASTRILYAMAKAGDAPKVLGYVSKRGIPTFSLLLAVLVGALALLTSVFDEGVVYIWLLNLSGLTGFINWVSIAWSHYRFRKGFLKAGHTLDELPYRAKLFPFGPLLALVVCLAVIFGQDYTAFISGDIDWQSIAAVYIGIPVFFALWGVRKVMTHSKIVKYEDMNFDTDESV